MCGGGGPMNLNIEPVNWEKYRCRECGKTFLSMARRPSCPRCSSGEVVRV